MFNGMLIKDVNKYVLMCSKYTTNDISIFIIYADFANSKQTSIAEDNKSKYIGQYFNTQQKVISIKKRVDKF